MWFHSRDRPKYHLKEDLETARNGSRGIGEGSDTMKVARDFRVEENNRPRLVVRLLATSFIILKIVFLLTVCNLQQSG